MPHDTHTSNLPDPPPPSVGASSGRQDGADPPRLLFWRRGPRRPTEPPPPIWELPELDPPGLWTRLKQRADRWLGQPVNQRATDTRTDTRMDTHTRDGAVRPAAPAPGQQPPLSRPSARREDTAQVRPPAASKPEREPVPPTEDSASPSISAAVLESAYEAVRQGRIADPATIRAIAERFARISPESALSDDLGFDPVAAVRALRQRADEMARTRGFDDEESDEEQAHSSSSSPARGRGSGSRAPRRSEAQIERDENITRGG